MTEQHDQLALEREEIITRVAAFKATQEKFQRERDAYCDATIEAARAIRWKRRAGGEIQRPTFDTFDGE